MLRKVWVNFWLCYKRIPHFLQQAYNIHTWYLPIQYYTYVLDWPHVGLDGVDQRVSLSVHIPYFKFLLTLKFTEHRVIEMYVRRMCTHTRTHTHMNTHSHTLTVEAKRFSLAECGFQETALMSYLFCLPNFLEAFGSLNVSEWSKLTTASHFWLHKTHKQPKILTWHRDRRYHVVLIIT